MCVGISMCTNTQMFTFCTYPVDFNSFDFLMNDLLALNINQSKSSTCAMVFFNIPSNRCMHQLPMLWISTHLNLKWMVYRHFCINQSNSSTRARTRRYAFFGVLIYRSSYNLPMLWISTHLNLEWMIYRRFCINQSYSSTRACACRYVFFGVLIFRCSYNLPMLW
jgi:hypothetical protein